jgi:hypothetical protein
MDPDISMLGWLVYGAAHKEPVSYWSLISDKADSPENENYYACQSSAHRIFHKNQNPSIYEGFKIKTIKRYTMIGYVLTGGFSGPNLLKGFIKKPIEKIEKTLENYPWLGSTRILVELEKIN